MLQGIAIFVFAFIILLVFYPLFVEHKYSFKAFFIAKPLTLWKNKEKETDIIIVEDIIIDIYYVELKNIEDWQDRHRLLTKGSRKSLKKHIFFDKYEKITKKEVQSILGMKILADLK